jgi:acyl-coenzyme A synthetase/AMP-(fatty) acid ligase
MEAWQRHLGEDVDAGALAAHVRERLSAYKCPKRFIEIEELPRNELGKVQKDELVRAAEEEVRADVVSVQFGRRQSKEE